MSDIYEVENTVVNAVGESAIDESEVIVGKPMSVSEFADLIQDLNDAPERAARD